MRRAVRLVALALSPALWATGFGCSRFDAAARRGVGASSASSASAPAMPSPRDAGHPMLRADDQQSAGAGTLHAGDEVYTIEPALVVAVEYESARRKIMIKRNPAGRFVADVLDGDGGMEHCAVDRMLRRILSGLATVRAVRVLGRAEAEAVGREYSGSAATLRVRDNIPTEAKEFLVVRAGNERTPIFRDGPFWFEPSVRGETLDALESACSTLAAKR